MAPSALLSVFHRSASPMFNNDLYPNQLVRLTVHVGFWLIMTVLIRYSYIMWDATDPKVIDAAHWLVAGNMVTIVGSYYCLVYVGLPLLYGKKWLALLLCLIGVYVYHTLCNYCLYTTVAGHYDIMKRIAGAYGEHGIVPALTEEKALLVNWSFTLSPLIIPLSIKVTKDVMMTRAKTIELERDNIRLEMNFLQAQIQPHFVFNSLNSVYSMVAGANDEAGDLVLRLSDLLRYALHETAHPTVPLSHEAAFLRGYTSIEAVRQHERTTIIYRQEGPLHQFSISPMILVTFVENAFKHGINATYRRAWADIRLTVTDEGALTFRVENSKPLVLTPGKKKSGIGIENTRRRLQLLYPDKHTLTIDNQAELFITNLTMRLETLPTAKLNQQILTTQPG